MKKVIIALVGFIVVFSVLRYSGALYFKGYVEKQLVEAAVVTSIHYDDIAISGFPFSIRYTIENPKFVLSQSHGNKAVNNVSIEGDLIVTTNLWGTDYTVEHTGKVHSYYDHMNRKRATVISNASNHLSFKVPFSQAFFGSLFQKVDSLLIESLHVTANDVVVNDQDSKEMLYRVVDFKADMNDLTLVDDRASFSYMFDMKGIEFAEQNASGPSNLSVTLHANMPVDTKTVKGEYVHIDISEFNYSDLFSQHEGSFKIDVKNILLDNVTGTVVFRSKNKLHEKYIENVLEEIVRLQTSHKKFREGTHGLSPENGVHLLDVYGNDVERFKAILMNGDILPRFHEMGVFELNFDVSIEEEARSRFAFKTGDYGLALSATTPNPKIKVGQTPQDYEVVMELTRYESLINDLLAYYNRAAPAFEKVTGKLAEFTLKPGFNDALKAFLQTVGKQSDDVLTITIESNSQSPVPMVGDDNILTILLRAQESLRPYVQKASKAPEGGGHLSGESSEMQICYIAAQRKDWKAALSYCEVVAENDALAQYYLAHAYLLSERPVSDFNAGVAFHWAERSVAGGDTNALYLLGRLYDKGVGVDKDPHKAMELYRQAFNHLRSERSALKIANLADSQGDYIEAYAWYMAAQNYGKQAVPVKKLSELELKLGDEGIAEAIERSLRYTELPR